MNKFIRTILFFFVVFSLAVMCCATALAAPNETLAMTKLLFVDDVAGLGQYTPKQGGRFVTGDICTIYIETTGFTLEPKPDAEGEFDIDLAVDIDIKIQRNGRVIVSEKDFNTLQASVRSQIPITFLAFSFQFDDAWNYDNYVMELTLRDNLSGQSAVGSLTYQLEEPTEADLVRQSQTNQPASQ